MADWLVRMIDAFVAISTAYYAADRWISGDLRWAAACGMISLLGLIDYAVGSGERAAARRTGCGFPPSGEKKPEGK